MPDATSRLSPTARVREFPCRGQSCENASDCWHRDMPARFENDPCHCLHVRSAARVFLHIGEPVLVAAPAPMTGRTARTARYAVVGLPASSAALMSHGPRCQYLFSEAFAPERLADGAYIVRASRLHDRRAGPGTGPFRLPELPAGPAMFVRMSWPMDGLQGGPHVLSCGEAGRGGIRTRRRARGAVPRACRWNTRWATPYVPCRRGVSPRPACTGRAGLTPEGHVRAAPSH